jgi:hypothetical protein
MSKNWFIRQNGREFGPLSVVLLKKIAAERKLQPTDYVRPEGTDKWTEASKVNGLLLKESTFVQDHATTLNSGSMDKAKRLVYIGTTIIAILVVGTMTYWIVTGKGKVISAESSSLIRTQVFAISDMRENAQDQLHGGKIESSDPLTLAKVSWDKFVAKVKSNAPAVEGAFSFEKRNLGADSLELRVVSDDLKQSTSIKHPFEGTVLVESVHVFSTRRSNFQYRMRFGYESSRWIFLGGHEKNESRSFDIDLSRRKYLEELFKQ